MSIRITQGMIYGSYVNNMQSSLGAYMNSAEQGASQKRVNSPSDDPAAAHKILNLRNTTTYNQQLLDNCDTAKGWLKLEDSVLSTQLPTVITSLKELAEQAATGTYTAEQRQQIAYQVREQFGTVLNLANTEFDGKNLFAGHKYNTPAFQEGLALMSQNEAWNKQITVGNYQIEGNANSTIAFQVIPENSGDPLQSGQSYRWTSDGGTNWTYGTVSTQSVNGTDYYVLDFNGVSIKIEDSVASNITLDTVDETEEGVSSNQPTVYIRPTAYYQGDVNDELQITYMGTAAGLDQTSSSKTAAYGTFSKNTLVRFDGDGSGNAVDLSQNSTNFQWSYSTDNGMNWVTVNGVTLDDMSAGMLRLPLPEGYLDVNVQSGDVPVGTQIMIHPEDANVDYEIMKDTFITVNGVGKDIFGGYYDGKPVFHGRTPELSSSNELIDKDRYDKTNSEIAFEDPGNNLFEVVGNFIAYLETNNQSGCQESLVKLTRAEEYILTQSTKVGGLENRVDVAYDVLTSQKLDIKERLSYVEDLDLTELLVKMQQQQITYQTVLQSASKIMNLSLANYL
ncbi:MAG: flagellar hook protein [Desulfovibrionaceae bacterium]|nr:flagellar hook protein [Desulfovibrionaceae bacterium]